MPKATNVNASAELSRNIEGIELSDAQNGTEQTSLTLWNVVGSALAAGIGVQSSRNRERDFHHGSVTTFIVAGIVFTALFVGTLLSIVVSVVSTG